MSSDVSGNGRVRTSKSTSLHKSKKTGKFCQILFSPPERGINQSLVATRDAFSQETAESESEQQTVVF